MYKLHIFYASIIYFLLYINYNNIEKCYIKTADVIIILVSNYFETFRYCWTIILLELSKMIIAYIDLLKYMIKEFLTYPNTLICSITSIILLYIVKLIIKDLIF